MNQCTRCLPELVNGSIPSYPFHRLQQLCSQLSMTEMEKLELQDTAEQLGLTLTEKDLINYRALCHKIEINSFHK